MSTAASPPEIDYSQSGEQQLLLDVVARLGLTGKLLDVGAGDGETYSNSRALLDAGWAGTLVEPAAWAFSRLIDRNIDSIVRRHVQACQAVVVPDRKGLTGFWYSKDDHLSTIDEGHRRTWSHVPFVPIFAAAVTMDDVLTAFGPFELTSIDAEGVSLSLLAAYRTHGHWPHLRVVCVEVESTADVARALAICGDGWEVAGETPNNLIVCRS